MSHTVNEILKENMLIATSIIHINVLYDKLNVHAPCIYIKMEIHSSVLLKIVPFNLLDMVKTELLGSIHLHVGCGCITCHV